MVKNHQVFVLHQFGNRKHYQALEHLLEKNNVKFIFRGLDIHKNFIKGIYYFDLKIFKKCFDTIISLFYLLFAKNHKVILGVRPFSINLLPLRIILRNHKIYYHTSYPKWEKVEDNDSIKKSYLKMLWLTFINNCQHIFVANNYIKNLINKEYEISKSKISVVYHSFDDKIFNINNSPIDESDFLKFIFVGRITESKGIKKILKIFQNSKVNSRITIVGKGDLADEVYNISLSCKNIYYHGFEKDQNKLSNLLRNSNYLLAPSIKQKVWEELFGINIIEAMACGVVPIASNHIGPNEIIENNTDGLLFNEDSFESEFYKFFNKVNEKTYEEMKKRAVLKSQKFTINNISKKWLKILEK
tara:strand:- start:2220 stop:3293 length:1074 start_codon:yes stop_codon:yes gene_type:complete